MGGEETACAIAIDEMSDIKYWVRNLERQPDTSFSLPTSTERLYPDFVAALNDGRTLVVANKGGDLISNEDSHEKRDVGTL